MSGYSSRPASARPQSRINPITGEEMPYADWGSARIGRGQQQQQVQHQQQQQQQQLQQQQQKEQLPQQQQQQQQYQHLQQQQFQQKQQQKQQQQHGGIEGPAQGYGYGPAASRPISRAEARPAAVPRLNLEQVIGADESSSYQPLPKNNNKSGVIGSPDTTISWGTRESFIKNNDNMQLVLEGQGTKPMVRPPVPPAPQVKLPSYRNNTNTWASKPPAAQGAGRGGAMTPGARPGGTYQGANHPSNLRGPTPNPPVERLKLEDLENEEQVKRHEIGREGERDTQREGEGDIEEAWKKDWTHAPYGKEAMRRITDKEELEEGKRKSKMLETVLIDQLNRPVMSDPMQTSSQSHRQNTYYQPGMKRGALRAMHDSKVNIDGTATENLLSKRVRFQARVLTSCGRDAIRELTGFYFAADSSLTVYEFRQFGKTSKAMPFIKRGCYCRLDGSQAGQMYSLVDITPGRDLVFETTNQPLPDNIKSRPHMTLRVSEVDNAAKMDILLEGVAGGRQEIEWERLHAPQTSEDQQRVNLLNAVQGEVRKQINRRGIRAYSGLGRLLRQALKQQNRLTASSTAVTDHRLNKFELEKSLIDFRIQLRQDMVDDLWEMLDVEATSFLNYDEFMRAYLGEMSEGRKAYVLKAFMKLDPTKTGATTLSEMRKFYNVRKHPKVRSGECEEEEILEAFLSSFQDMEERGKISYKEFEEYYEGLSVCVNSDEDFINILKNTWNI